MSSYIIYTSEYGDCIVEILNEGTRELYRIQKELIAQGYYITEVIGIFIKCRKVEEDE